MNTGGNGGNNDGLERDGLERDGLSGGTIGRFTSESSNDQLDVLLIMVIKPSRLTRLLSGAAIAPTASLALA
jgi:hypothetical protein